MFTTLFVTLITGTTTAFQPLNMPRTNRAVRMGSDDGGNILEQAGDAVRDAFYRMDNADDMPAPGAASNRLTGKEEKDMWDAQRELQANRNAHSSKSSRAEKYSGEPIVENDKHGELKTPWTKSEDSFDHNSRASKNF